MKNLRILPGRMGQPRFCQFSKWFSLGVFLILSCGGGSKQMRLYVPDDMPEICNGLDFNRDVNMREMCGVSLREYKAYRNIPEHRMLQYPKGARIVQKSSGLELRVPEMIPVGLPQSWDGRILFGETYRRVLIISKMDYVEFLNPSGKPMRVMRLEIPFQAGDRDAACFTLLPPMQNTPTKKGYAGTLKPLGCDGVSEIPRTIPYSQ